ncbi:MAG: hypothetical protein Q9207_002282 [Kuettlingeria erythrocarpa]
MAVFASLRAIAFPPPAHPPPSGPLPDLPLEAAAGTPPPTPRNANHLYGEYSWPSLDMFGLQSRLEDIVAEAEGDGSPEEVSEAEDSGLEELDDDHHYPSISINQLVTAMQTLVSSSPLGNDLYNCPTPKLISLAHTLRKDFNSIRREYLPANEEELMEYLAAKADYHHQVTMLDIDSGFCFEGCPLQEDCAFFDEGCPYRLRHECWGSHGCGIVFMEGYGEDICDGDGDGEAWFDDLECQEDVAGNVGSAACYHHGEGYPTTCWLEEEEAIAEDTGGERYGICWDERRESHGEDTRRYGGCWC